MSQGNLCAIYNSKIKCAITRTFPSLLKNFSRSLEVTLVDKPVTYKLFPGLDASTDWLLEQENQFNVKLNSTKLEPTNSVWIKPQIFQNVTLKTIYKLRFPEYLERLLLDLDNDLDRRPLTGEGELCGEADLSQ